MAAVGLPSKLTDLDVNGTFADGDLIAWDAGSGDWQPLTPDFAASDHQHVLADITDAGTAASRNTGTSAGQVPILGVGGKLASSTLPAIAITDTFVVNDESEMLALAAETGDVAVRMDTLTTFILQGTDPTNLAHWVQLRTPTDAVQSVNGQTGAVNLTTDDIPEGGSNFYYTDQRVSDWLQSNNQGNVQINGTFTAPNIDTAQIDSTNTGEIAFGSTVLSITASALTQFVAALCAFVGLTFTSRRTNLGANTGDGLIAENTTASTVGVPVQVSPSLRLRGRAQKTNAPAADHTADWRVYVQTTAGAASIGSVLVFSHSLNGAAYTNPVTIDQSGQLTAVQVSSNNGFFSGGAFRSTGGSTTNVGAQNMSTNNSVAVGLSGGSWTQSGGTANIGVSIAHTLNQTGAAPFDDLRFTRTETGVGSGEQNFINCFVGTSQKFRVTNGGNVYALGGTVYFDSTSTTRMGPGLIVWNSMAGGSSPASTMAPTGNNVSNSNNTHALGIFGIHSIAAFTTPSGSNTFRAVKTGGNIATTGTWTGVFRSLAVEQTNTSNSGGTHQVLALENTINQAGGSQNTTALFINNIETALSSGSHKFIHCQGGTTGGTDKFYVDRQAAVYMANVASPPGTPTGGCVLYFEGDVLKYKNTAGTVKTVTVT